MIAGGDGTPKHLFPDCPYVKRMMGLTNVVGTYRLSPSSRVLNLIRCKWCRTRYLGWLVEDPEIPTRLIEVLSLARRRKEEKAPPP